MRNLTQFTGLMVALSLNPVIQAGEGSLSERLEKLAPRAAGIAQVEVIETKEIDARPADGSLYLDVRFRVLRKSGRTLDGVQIILAGGGHTPPNTPPFKPSGPVKFDTFTKGERYWIAFSSQYDWERCPQRVVRSWTDRDHPAVLEEAVRTDHYNHQPLYHAKTGLTHSFRVAKDGKSWLVRMERDDHRLWEVSLPGEKYHDQYEGEWSLVHRDHWPGLENAEGAGWFLLAETATELEATNDYSLPAGKYRLMYALNADSGKTAAIWVSRLSVSPMAHASVVQYFDLKSRKVRREERYDSLQKGGLAAGAPEDTWLRKLVRTFHPKSGKLLGEEIFRWTASPEGSKYVPVNRP